MNLRYIALVVCLFFSTASLQAQSRYHRVYEANENGDTLVHHLASAAITNGAIISVLGRQIDGEYKTLVLMKLDQKGNIQADAEFDFGQDSINNIMDVDLTFSNDSVQFTMTLDVEGNLSTAIGKWRAGRTFEFEVRQVSGADLTIDPIGGATAGLPLIEDYDGSRVLHSVSDDGVYVSLLDTARLPLWTQRYTFSTEDGSTVTSSAYGLEASRDSLIYSHGLLADGRLYQLVIDSLSAAVYAKSYDLGLSSVVPNVANISVETQDRSVFAGYYDSTIPSSTSYVVMTDTIGDVLWAKSIIIDGRPTEVYDVKLQNGEVRIAGKYFQEPDSTKLFVAALASDGSVSWVTDFGSAVVDTDLKNMNLDRASDGRSIIGVNGFMDSGEPGIAFVTIDALGATPCSAILDTEIAFDIEVTTDTLLVERGIGLTYGQDTLAYLEEDYSGLIEPRLAPRPTTLTYCPNEIIDTFFTATVTSVDTANVSFVWAFTSPDMVISTTDTALVTKEGMYFRTATITENVCYELCDTFNVQRTTEPTASIIPDYSSLCTTGAIILKDTVENGQPPFSHLWGGGETTPSIEVATDGTYTVLVTDQCGDQSSALIDITIPDVVTTVNDTTRGDFCADGFISINLGISTSAILGTETITIPSNYSINWNTGESTNPLQVTENGTYNYTVLDECGNMVTGSIDVDNIPVVGPDTDVSISTEETDCESESFAIRATLGSDVDNFKFYSLDANGKQISPLPSTFFIETIGNVRAATYQYEVGCDTIPGDTIFFSQICPSECIRFANVFFPTTSTVSDTTTSADAADQVFRPYVLINCVDQSDPPPPIEEVISTEDYIFVVYNRYGQEIFTTDDIQASWDGTFNGELVPSEAYLWYAQYKYLGEEEQEPRTQKGNITAVY